MPHFCTLPYSSSPVPAPSSCCLWLEGTLAVPASILPSGLESWGAAGNEAALGWRLLLLEEFSLFHVLPPTFIPFAWQAAVQVLTVLWQTLKIFIPVPIPSGIPFPSRRGHREATWGLVASSLIPARPILQTAAQAGSAHVPPANSLAAFSTMPYSHSESMNMAVAQCKGEAEHFFGNNKAFHW